MEKSQTRNLGTLRESVSLLKMCSLQILMNGVMRLKDLGSSSLQKSLKLESDLPNLLTLHLD